MKLPRRLVLPVFLALLAGLAGVPSALRAQDSSDNWWATAGTGPDWWVTQGLLGDLTPNVNAPVTKSQLLGAAMAAASELDIDLAPVGGAGDIYSALATWQSNWPANPFSGSITPTLHGEYYNNLSEEGDPVMETDEVVDLYWGESSPDSTLMDPGNFSANWSGSFEVPADGYYVLNSMSSGGLFIFVDGAYVVQYEHGESQSNTIWLSAGLHSVGIDFSQFDGSPSEVHWSLDSSDQYGSSDASEAGDTGNAPATYGDLLGLAGLFRARLAVFGDTDFPLDVLYDHPPMINVADLLTMFNFTVDMNLNSDVDGIGMTLLQEYIIGSDPNDPDPWGDGTTAQWRADNGLSAWRYLGNATRDDGVTYVWLARNGLNLDADLSHSTRGDGVSDQWRYAHGYDLSTDLGYLFSYSVPENWSYHPSSSRGDGVSDQWRYDHGYDLSTDLGYVLGYGQSESWLLQNGYNLLNDIYGFRSDSVNLIWLARNGLKPNANLNVSRSDGTNLLWLAHNGLDLDADLSHSSRGDGVPDQWMYDHGYDLGADLSLDSDGDGVSDHQEFLNGTDPHDYFNGQPHFFTTIEGSNQTGPRGAFLEYPWTVKVTDAHGHFFVNAPVTFWFNDDEPGYFSTTGDDSSPLVRKITVRTDEHGLAWVYVQQ